MTDEPRKLKRSSALRLTTLMAASGLALSACDQAADWDKVSRRDEAPAFAYRTLGDCQVANEISDEECEAAYKTAVADDDANGPRYDGRDTCEEVYGPGECVPRSQNSGSGNFWGPLLTGYVVGRMLDGGGNSYYRGTGMYRDRDGGQITTYGGRLNRDYATGRTTVDKYGMDSREVTKSAPPKVQTRSQVVSRSGFGGSSRGYRGG